MEVLNEVVFTCSHLGRLALTRTHRVAPPHGRDNPSEDISEARRGTPQPPPHGVVSGCIFFSFLAETVSYRKEVFARPAAALVPTAESGVVLRLGRGFLVNERNRSVRF